MLKFSGTPTGLLYAGSSLLTLDSAYTVLAGTKIPLPTIKRVPKRLTPVTTLFLFLKIRNIIPSFFFYTRFKLFFSATSSRLKIQSKQ